MLEIFKVLQKFITPQKLQTKKHEPAHNYMVFNYHINRNGKQLRKGRHTLIRLQDAKLEQVFLYFNLGGSVNICVCFFQAYLFSTFTGITHRVRWPDGHNWPNYDMQSQFCSLKRGFLLSGSPSQSTPQSGFTSILITLFVELFALQMKMLNPMMSKITSKERAPVEIARPSPQDEHVSMENCYQLYLNVIQQ